MSDHSHCTWSRPLDTCISNASENQQSIQTPSHNRDRFYFSYTFVGDPLNHKHSSARIVQVCRAGNFCSGSFGIGLCFLLRCYPLHYSNYFEQKNTTACRHSSCALRKAIRVYDAQDRSSMAKAESSYSCGSMGSPRAQNWHFHLPPQPIGGWSNFAYIPRK